MLQNLLTITIEVIALMPIALLLVHLTSKAMPPRRHISPNQLSLFDIQPELNFQPDVTEQPELIPDPWLTPMLSADKVITASHRVPAAFWAVPNQRILPPAQESTPVASKSDILEMTARMLLKTAKDARMPRYKAIYEKQGKTALASALTEFLSC